MDSFQRNVLAGVFIIIVVILVVVYFVLKKTNKSATWPPFLAPCPDYWVQDASSGICTNPKGLGSFSNPFSVTYDPSNQSACCNYLYATQNELAWDGLTYGVNPNPSTPLCPSNPVCNNS